MSVRVCVCPEQVYVWLNLLCGWSQCHAMIKRQHWNKGKNTFSLSLSDKLEHKLICCMSGKRTSILPRSEKAGVSEKARDAEMLFFCLMKSTAALWPLRRSCSPFPFLSLFLSIFPGSSSAYWSLLQPLFLSFSEFGSATLSSSFLWKTRFRLRVIQIIQF